MPCSLRGWTLMLAWLVGSASAQAADFVYRPLGLQLYQADDVVRARIPGGPIKLGGFVHQISDAVQETLLAYPRDPATSGFGAAVVLIFKPDRRFQHWLLSSQPLPAALATNLARALDKLPAPPIQDGPLVMSMRFQAWGGGPVPEAAAPLLPTPEPWLRALGGPARKPMTDADIARIWP